MVSRATKPATPAAVADAAGRAQSDELESASAAVPGASMDAAPAERPQIPPGTMVSDRYRVARVLGEGGMGVVYAAEHVLMRKEVAVKVLHADMCSMPEVVARFEREAIAAAHIDHPNVAGATDFGRLPDGSCFLVLELLRGVSLRDEIKRGPIPRTRALNILRGIASGVSAAHVKGIVHRDLKPENVMLVERDGATDFVKVLDFGIAKVDTSVATAPQAGTSKILTRVGSVFGTPEYMAPEQAVGDTVDARADLYALGVILLEMITGKCPYQGNPLSILRERILSVGPPDMSVVSDPDVRALVERLLVRDPDQRMQTAPSLVAAIDVILSRGSIPAPVVSLPTPGPVAAALAIDEASAATDPSRSRAVWIVAAVAALGLVIGVSAYALVSTLARTKADVTGQTPASSVVTEVAATTESVASENGPAAGSGIAATATAEPSEGHTAEAVSTEAPLPTTSAAAARAAPRPKAPKARPAKKGKERSR